MYSRPFSRYLFLCCLIVLLAAYGLSAGTTTTPTVSTSKTPGVASPTSVPTTVPTQQPSTSCPATGAARAAVMPPMTLGSHANIVYIVSGYQASGQATSVTLRRYDVTTGSKTVIVKLAGISISESQVSADGWTTM